MDLLKGVFSIHKDVMDDIERKRRVESGNDPKSNLGEFDYLLNIPSPEQAA